MEQKMYTPFPNWVINFHFLLESILNVIADLLCTYSLHAIDFW